MRNTSIFFSLKYLNNKNTNIYKYSTSFIIRKNAILYINSIILIIQAYYQHVMI